MRLKPLSLGFLLCAALGCDGGDEGGASEGADAEPFVGSWERVGTVVDGAPSSAFCFAQLDLTATTWHSFTTGGGAEFCDCDLQGDLALEGSTMTWTNTAVEGEFCGVSAPGDVTSYAWRVDGDRLTITTGNVTDQFQRIGTGGEESDGDNNGESDGEPNSDSCDQRSSMGTCADFVGAAWDESEKERFCTPGTLQAGACTDDNAVGSCELETGTSREHLLTFYSDGNPAFDDTMAQMTCSNLGGAWTG